MALLDVEFERIHSSGLLSSNVYLNGELLKFENDIAKAQLEKGENFELYWRIFGNPRSHLTIKYTVEGQTKTAVDKSKIASNRNRKSDFTFLTLGEKDD